MRTSARCSAGVRRCRLAGGAVIAVEQKVPKA